MYALRGRRVAKAKAHIYCFYDIILLFKSVQRWRRSENHQIWAAYFMDGPFPKFYICMSLCSLLELKFGIYDISYTIFYTKFNIFYTNSIQWDHFITVETNLIMFLCKKCIWFILANLILLYYWVTF